MTDTLAIRVHHYGGPEQLRLETVSLGAPGPDEVLVRQTAIGVNYHDVYVRSGLYKTLALPGTPGIEAVGIVEAVGEAVETLRAGDRIGYVAPEYGAYAARRLLPARRGFHLPGAIDDVGAAGSLMKALTACMLLRNSYAVEAGDVILVHAAAGGVGQMLCRWGRHLGATVIGTVGSADKAAIAAAAGASHTILYREQDFRASVMDITGGRGVAAIYDSVGQDTFLQSLDCLDYGGRLVNFGQSSGAVAPFAPALLSARSASVSRPIIFHYLRDAASAKAMMGEVTEAFRAGALAALPAATLPLAEAPEAHRMLEGRASPGAVVLVP